MQYDIVTRTRHSLACIAVAWEIAGEKALVLHLEFCQQVSFAQNVEGCTGESGRETTFGALHTVIGFTYDLTCSCVADLSLQPQTNREHMFPPITISITSVLNQPADMAKQNSKTPGADITPSRHCSGVMSSKTVSKCTLAYVATGGWLQK